VNGALEWGSQNTCSPILPVEYAPQRITVTLEGTCNEAWCIAWADEAGPVKSAWTYSRVATVFATEPCDTNEKRKFRIRVRVQFAGGDIDYGTARSSAWSNVKCDV
jgi:hypothetical protein